MNYRSVGKSGIHVSQLCFGTMSFGGEVDEKTSEKMYHSCREHGINFFDTANVYADGKSEEILGKLIRDERDQVIITSKVCGPMGPTANDRGLSRRHIMIQVEESLKRLQTDRIEFYFVHNFDQSTPIEETLAALDFCVKQGKILHPCISNWAAWQISKALGISKQEKFSDIFCIQPMYNLLKRQAEVELLPLAQSEGLGVIPYSPLGGGLLTGKYGVDRRPLQGRIVDKEQYALRYNEDSYFESVDRFLDYAKNVNIHPVTLAVAWVGAHPAVTAPIIGARNIEQLMPSLSAADFFMPKIMRDELNLLTPTPPSPTDRSEVYTS